MNNLTYPDAISAAIERANRDRKPMAIYIGKRINLRTNKTATCYWVRTKTDRPPDINATDGNIKLHQIVEPEPKIIHILGRKWFDKVNGNTYHRTDIYVDGDYKIRTQYAYGYGDQYLQSGQEWLEENGYLPSLEHYDNGGTESLWRYCERMEIKLNYSSDYLPRKKDLNQ